MMRRLHRADAILVVIDVQEKLIPVIHRNEELQRNIDHLVRGCHILRVPSILTEQYVKGLGPTTTTVREAFEQTVGYAPIEKMCFSSMGCEAFIARLRERERQQVLVAGIETHVCVWQTVIDLLDADFAVTVIADAVSSRTEENRQIALRRMEREGARLSSTEMALFEMCVMSGTDEFRAISKLVK